MSRATREPVWSLDREQVVPLEDGVRTLHDVVEDLAEQRAVAQPRPNGHRCEQPLRRRTPALDRIAQDRHSSGLVILRRRDLDDRLLQAQPGRGVVLADILTEALQPGDLDPGRRLDPTIALDHDVHAGVLTLRRTVAPGPDAVPAKR